MTENYCQYTSTLRNYHFNSWMTICERIVFFVYKTNLLWRRIAVCPSGWTAEFYSCLKRTREATLWPRLSVVSIFDMHEDVSVCMCVCVCMCEWVSERASELICGRFDVRYAMSSAASIPYNVCLTHRVGTCGARAWPQHQCRSRTPVDDGNEAMRATNWWSN